MYRLVQMSAIHADFAFESRLLPKVERARWKLDTMVELPNKNSLRRVRFLPALLLLVTAVCSAFVWTVSSPTGSSPDEESHISHSWGVGTGQVLPWTIEQVEHPTNGATSAVITLPAALMQHPQPSCYRDQAYNNECGPPEPAAGDVETFSYMARYPMTYYAIAGFSMRIGLASGLSGFSTLILARVVSGVVGYLLLGLASWLLARRFGWQAATIPILALMVPNTHFLLNSINPNGFEIAATAALAACVISIRHDVLRTGKCSTSLQVLLVVLILAAGWTRPLSVVWTGMILLILWVPGRRRRPLLFELSKPLVVLIFVGVAFLLGWFYYEATGTRTESVGVDEWEKLPAWLQFWMVVTRFGDMFRNGYGLLGWADYEIPLFSFILWILVACAVTTALIVGSRRTVLRPRIAAFVVLGSMVVITLAECADGLWLAGPVLAAATSRSAGFTGTGHTGTWRTGTAAEQTLVDPHRRHRITDSSRTFLQPVALPVWLERSLLEILGPALPPRWCGCGLVSCRWHCSLHRDSRTGNRLICVGRLAHDEDLSTRGRWIQAAASLRFACTVSESDR